MNWLAKTQAASLCYIVASVLAAQAQDTDILPSRAAPYYEYVATWPDAISGKVSKKLPLKYESWDKPYGDEAGKAAVDQINSWFEDGSAAGLSQDAFRSFDSNHSKVGSVYPQMTMAKPIADYRPANEAIYSNRVTFGVQSLGFHKSVFNEAMAIAEFHDRCSILERVKPSHLKRKIGVGRPVVDASFYRALYESNCLLICPAVWNFQVRQDGGYNDNLSFLSPFFLYSVGKSGSDSYLMKPILYAAASFSPELKTRMLRSGTYVPSLLGLFKAQLGGGDLLSAAAHPSAYTLPESGPFLELLINKAHKLKHIPPVTRVRCVGEKPDDLVLVEERYLITSALREGEVLELEIDLSDSWTDVGQKYLAAEGKILREPDGTETLQADLKKLLVEFTERHPLVEQTRARIKKAQKKQSTLAKVAGHESRWRLRVPWQSMCNTTGLKRTDVVFVANDGTYDGAPAYVSVRHLQQSDRWLRE
jgi:hypothetical protein